ncbi:RICIN domain-containing protein [Kibdelosporangium philippinense]|uniref:RICIN domain-containing protein n=1 Tax=Kibdelosporangium philippinense TaxID=211113 RepID=A0ABS8ZT01_9PSEU|nr:RICIN domain-containing protein [Kibdelosporangium philippinense]MCE7010120.1 RICIN domain-containing protein [Kibdelosporangium philippinense]
MALTVAVLALLFSMSGVTSAEPGVPGPSASPPVGTSDPRVNRPDCDSRMHPSWRHWEFEAADSGLVMDVKNAVRDVIVWRDTNGTNQTWVVEPAAEGGSYLHPCYDRTKCLDVPNGQYVNNTPLIVFACNGAHNQRFGFAGSWIVPFHSPTSKCLNVDHGIVEGRRVILWNCDGAINSQWQFHPM